MTRGSAATVAASPSAKIGAVDEHGHPPGEVEDEVHVVLDQQHRHLGRQGVDDVEDLLSFAFGHAGHRLVEQQHPRPAGERHRDLEQAALAVGQLGDALALDVLETELTQQRIARRPDPRVGAEPPPPAGADAELPRDRERERLQRRQPAEELVDLECAHDAASHPPVRRQAGDVVAIEPDRAGARLQGAGEQVDQGRLAGAVRADQGVAGAEPDLERDVVRRRRCRRSA